ncbi:MAG: Rieske 2Fe-2S domain-containing protein [Acidobacteriota bacterium]|nr:Rieske 2Fe-2S domain-containing protein [Acidobacteriota bacterium]
MSKLLVGKVTDFKKRDRKIVVQGDLEIGVFRIGEDFYAYDNQCAHRGGPVCQGKILEKVEEVLAEDKTSRGLQFSKESVHIICPWHGFEYDLRSGVNAGDKTIRLKKYEVKVQDGSVYVII